MYFMYRKYHHLNIILNSGAKNYMPIGSSISTRHTDTELNKLWTFFVTRFQFGKNLIFGTGNSLGLKTFTERKNLISINMWPWCEDNIQTNGRTDRHSHFIILDDGLKIKLNHSVVGWWPTEILEQWLACQVKAKIVKLG